jgi:hypothetical protein
MFRRVIVLVRAGVALGVEYDEAGSIAGRLPRLLDETRVGVVCVGVSGLAAEMPETLVVPEAEGEMPDDVEGVIIALSVSVPMLSGGSSNGPKNGFRAFVGVVSGSSEPDVPCTVESLPVRL